MGNFTVMVKKGNFGRHKALLIVFSLDEVKKLITEKKKSELIEISNLRAY